MKEHKTTLFLFRYSSLQALHEVLCSFVRRIPSTENLFDLPIHTEQEDPFYKGGLMVMADKKEELISKLDKVIDKIKSGQPIRFPLGQKIYHAAVADRRGKVAFLFPGFGSEHPGMLTGLEEKFPRTEKWLSMARTMLDVPSSTTSAQLEEAAKARFSEKEVALMQKGSLGIIASLAYHDILCQLNIPCDAMVGHSNGENAALIASGIIQFKDDAEIVDSIKKIIGIPAIAHNRHEGQYLVVNNYSSEKLKPFLKKFQDQAFLAMKNCPSQMVIFAVAEKFEAVRRSLSEERAIAIPLYTDHPYHTPLYAKQAETIRNIYPGFNLTRGTTPLYSCVDAAPFFGNREMITDKAVSQWTEVVDFESTINTLYEDGFTFFIEVGPNNKLTNFVKDTLKNKSCTAINSNLADKNNVESLAELAAMLWINGIDADISVFNTKSNITAQHNGITLPGAASNPNEAAVVFKKYQQLMQQFLEVQERSWNMFRQEVENRKNLPKTALKFVQAAFPLLAEPVRASANALYIEKQYTLAEYPFFKDHALGHKLAVIPFTVSLEIVAEAALLLSGENFKVTGLQNVSGHAWLALENDRLDVGIEATISAHKGLERSITVTIYELGITAGAKKKAFEATVSLSAGYTAQPNYVPTGNPIDLSLKPAAAFYAEDLFHGPYFTGIAKVGGLNGSFLTADMQMPSLKEAFSFTNQPVFRVPGALLDCSGQLAAYWLMSNQVEDFAVFPFSLESYTQFAVFPPEGSPLRCDAKIIRMQTVIEADFNYYDTGNKLLATLKGFKMILYQHKLIPPILMGNLQPAQLESTLTPEFLMEAGGIWKRTLAASLLHPADYMEWLALQTTETKVDYLLRHIQHKYSTL